MWHIVSIFLAGGGRAVRDSIVRNLVSCYARVSGCHTHGRAAKGGERKSLMVDKMLEALRDLGAPRSRAVL